MTMCHGKETGNSDDSEGLGSTEEECEDIKRLVGRERLIQITANPTLTGLTASKIMWVKKRSLETDDEDYSELAKLY